MSIELALYFQFIGQLTLLAGGYAVAVEIYQEIKNGGDDE